MNYRSNFNKIKRILFVVLALALFIVGIVILTSNNIVQNTSDAGVYDYQWHAKGYCKNSATSSTAYPGSYTGENGATYNPGYISVRFTDKGIDNATMVDAYNCTDKSAAADAGDFYGIAHMQSSAWGTPTYSFNVNVSARANSGFGIVQIKTVLMGSQDSAGSFASSYSTHSSNYTLSSYETGKMSASVSGGWVGGYTRYSRHAVIFNPISYSVNFKNGSSTYSSVSTTYGDYFNLPSGTPKKTGYNFANWYSSENGGTQITSSYIKGTLYNTIYAHWSPISYTITYSPGEKGTGTQMSSTSCTYDSSYSLRKNTYTRKGYSFAGWKINGSGSKIYSDQAYISNLTSSHNATINMVAQWTANQYTVSYSANGGIGSTDSQSINYDSDFYLKDSTGFSREGHYFTSWNESSDGTGTSWSEWINRAWPYTYDYSITLYAQWKKEEYTYNFYNDTKANKGTIDSSAGVTYGQTFNSFPIMQKNGFTQTGWRIEDTGDPYWNEMEVFDHGGNGASVNFYPVWSANTIHISLSTTHGSLGTREFWYKYNTNKFYSNSACTSQISSISIPTYTGYRFDDYHGNGSSGGDSGELYIRSDGTFASDLYCDIYKDATLYASWTAKTYTLSFHYNILGKEIESTKTVTFNQPYGALPTASTGKHIFLGWFTSSSGGTEVTSSMTYTTDGDQTLYAHWEETWACHTIAPSGSGTANSPYLIDSANKLAWVIENFGSGKTYKQTADIDMSSYTWLPIGTTNNPFSGNYIGNGNKILNLKTSKNISDIRDGREDNVGLFGVVDNAYIETVIMRGADIIGRNNVGGFVGYAKGKLTIDSSIFDGKVIATSNYGGLIGSSASGSAIITSSVSKLNSSSSTSPESLLRGQTAVCKNSIGINQSGNLYTTGDYNASSWAIIDGMTYPLPNKLSWIANGQ